MRDIQLSKLDKSDTFGGFKGGFVVFFKLQFWLDLEIKIILNYKLCEMNMAPFMSFRVILVIKWQHNTWTNMIVKMTILRLLGLSDDKEKIGVARPEGPPLRWFQGTRIEETVKKSKSKRSKQRQFAITG